MESLLGSALEIGKFITFIHPDSQDDFYPHVLSLLKQGSAQKCRLRLLSVEGIRTIIMESILLHKADRAIIRSAVIDVSQEEALTRDLMAGDTALIAEMLTLSRELDQAIQEYLEELKSLKADIDRELTAVLTEMKAAGVVTG